MNDNKNKTNKYYNRKASKINIDSANKNNLIKKSKSVGIINKLKSYGNMICLTTNNVKPFKDLNTEKYLNSEFYLNEANSTKYKNLDLDDLLIQTPKILNTYGNEDILDNINQKLIGLDDHKNYEGNLVGIIDHENLKIIRKDSKKNKENNLSENENFVKKELNFEQANNINNALTKGFLEKGKGFKNKFINQNFKANITDYNTYNQTTNKNQTPNDLSNQNQTKALSAASDSNIHSYTQKDSFNNLTNHKDNINNFNSSALNKFIVIGGYPAIKEALLKRNLTELTDIERYLFIYLFS